MSWKGRTFDSRRDLTFSEIHRRVAWGIVGLLDGTRLGSCHHQSLSRGGRHLSIPSHRIDLRNPECHSSLYFIILAIEPDRSSPNKGPIMLACSSKPKFQTVF